MLRWRPLCLCNPGLKVCHPFIQFHVFSCFLGDILAAEWETPILTPALYNFRRIIVSCGFLPAHVMVGLGVLSGRGTVGDSGFIVLSRAP